jgi:hypothetical protein
MTRPTRGRAQPGGRVTRRVRPGLVAGLAAGVLTVALASACDTTQQVPWDTYSVQLQDQIDAATATHHCAALEGFLHAAKATSSSHEKATGVPNDALVAYIQAAQQTAGCAG